MADQSKIELAGSKKRPSRLGRGLSSLMAAPVSAPVSAPGPGAIAQSGNSPRDGEALTEAAGMSPEQAGAGGYIHLPLEVIQRHPSQPRQHFDEASLKRLAASLKSEGLMQPVIVRPIGGGRYELVAGERRWRAAERAGLSELPAFVKTLDDRQVAEWALIENLQREDLNPIERAEAFERLGEQFSLTHADIADRVGLERSTVTNLLRLLKLHPPVREMVARGQLSMGQSRALAGLDDATQQQALAERTIRDGLSVRQVEAEVKAADGASANPSEPAQKPVRAAYLDDLERQIGEQLSTKVQIKTARKKGAGSLTIAFYDIDQFDGLLAKLGVETQ